jgi:hypothetical protein
MKLIMVFLCACSTVAFAGDKNPPKPHKPIESRSGELRVADCRGGSWYRGKLSLLCKTIQEEKKK